MIAASASAQQYPSKPVRFVVPYAAGGATDLIARVIGERLAAGLGQPFVIENRPGAATLLGAQIVAKAEPDGYTLLMATSTTLAINASLYKSLPYDPVKDFAPISLAIQHPFVLLVDPKLPAHSVKELVALAKAKPGQLAYASGGSGSFPHLAMAMFQSMTGIDVIHVPYKGSAPALTDLMGGQVAMIFDNTALNYVKSGKIRALAVTTKDRLSVMPDVPTADQSGLPGFEVGVWYGFAVPSGTPRPALERLNAEIVKLLHEPDTQKRLTGDGGQIITSTPDQFAAYIKSEIGRFAKIVRDSGAKVE
ncbi:MAG TPA: tripartite tricarboxylate transporter substrate binding protein [Burkholderiales bacterium]|nr:tripartite tricarboxylate transporter substrate binding protein [Burkholderiales bacterium]